MKSLTTSDDAICLNFFAGPTNPEFKAELNFYNVHYAFTHIVGTSGGNTDDMREAPSLVIIENLLAAGAEVWGYDPAAMDEAKRIFADRINYAEDPFDALIDADCLVIRIRVHPGPETQRSLTFLE